MTPTLRRTLDALVIVLPPLVIAAVASATRSFWGDEILTLQLAATPGADILTTLAAGSHPPLYFLLVKGWIGLFGDGEVGLRMLQALQGMLLVGLTLALQRKLLAPARWHLFFVLFVLSSALWLHMPMLRPFTLAAVLATALTLVHVRWIAGPTRALDVWHIVLSLALLFIDSSASIVIALHLVHTAATRRDLLVRHLVTIVIAAAAFAPWLAMPAAEPDVVDMLDQGGGWGSVPFTMLWMLIALIAGETSTPIDPWVIAMLVALVPVVLIGRLRGKLFVTAGSGLLLLVVIGGLLFTTVMSLFETVPPNFNAMPPRALFALPLVFLLLGMWWQEVPLAWLRGLTAVLLVLGTLPSLWNLQTGTSFMMPTYASPWKQIVSDTRGGYVLSAEPSCYAWYAARTPGASVLINDWDSTRVDALLADSTARIFTVLSDGEGSRELFDMSTYYHILSYVEPVWQRAYLSFDDRSRLVREILLYRNDGQGKFTVHEVRPISRARLDSLIACEDGAPY